MNAAPIYRVRHTSRYAYAETVSRSMHQVRLTPRNSETQTVRDARLLIDPPARGAATREDYFGNAATTFTIDEAHVRLQVTAESLVSVSGGAGGGLDSPSLAETLARLRARGSADALAAAEYQVESPLAPRGGRYARYAAASLRPHRPLLEGAGALMETIYREFTYDPVATSVSTPVSEVLENRHGVCQDFAHLMIACLRSHGVPARYVSGYLVPGPGVTGAQASHAWVSVYCPDVGWVDFDPTNNVRPAGGHVTLSRGRDFEDVSPVKGVTVGGGRHDVAVEVLVAPAA